MRIDKRIRNFFRGYHGYQGTPGRDGDSAYEVWVKTTAGDDKSLDAFWKFLRGTQGGGL